MSKHSKTAPYRTLLRHWYAMAAGRSYWHLRQDEGTQFVPGMLAGYFNDLTGKTNWSGPLDSDGIPLVQVNGSLQYFPVTTFQKGLGHWDRWLRSIRGDAEQFHAFEQTARWALLTRDERGGWRIPTANPTSTSLYSAMSQGEGTSLLCRAYSTTRKEAYLGTALSAAQLMLSPISAGGTARYEKNGVILEEYPSERARTVLNGWIFALYGLYDLNLVMEDPQIEKALHDTISALTASLPIFDAGYWSFYDSGGTLASPFYHRLHIAQLRSLQKTFPGQSETFRQVADHFELQLAKGVDRVRAIVTKGYQKLRNPPPVVIS